MKKRLVIALVAMLAALFIISGCSKKSDIKGEWKVQNSSGTNYVLKIDKKKMDFSASGEGVLDYTVKKQGTEDGIPYVAVVMRNTDYTIIFPEKDNETAILLINTGDGVFDGQMVAAMNKSSKPDFKTYTDKYGKLLH
ncbi:hypothetical protein [Streptococcus dentiloxodontae]